MDRNYLKGVAGDMMNAILAAAGDNMRKLLAAFLSALLEMGLVLQNLLRELAKYLRQTIFTCPNLLQKDFFRDDYLGTKLHLYQGV